MTTRQTARSSDVLTSAVATAVGAPSIMNTQPWRWRITDRTAELWLDRTRQLATLDPIGRFATLSCGTALHYLRTALTAQGKAGVIELLPEHDTPDLLARVELITEPEPDPVSARHLAARHLDALTARHTDRRAFAPEPLAPSTLEAIAAAADDDGAALEFVRPDQLTSLILAAGHAGDLELADPGYVAELATWTSRPAEAGDGVPTATTPPDSPRRVPLRNFTPDGGAGLDPGAGDDRGASYAILHTAADTPEHWLRAGLALGAVLGTAAEYGAATSPMSDMVEVPATEQALRRILAGRREPMLVLRIGRPATATPPPATPRRAPSEIIEPGE